MHWAKGGTRTYPFFGSVIGQLSSPVTVAVCQAARLNPTRTEAKDVPRFAPHISGHNLPRRPVGRPKVGPPIRKFALRKGVNGGATEVAPEKQ
jgi:hypothetical protein